MRSKSIFATALATALVAAPAAIRAAPDQTPGMALMSAIVTADGDRVGGAGAVSSVFVGTGAYKVKLNRNLQGCTCAAMHVGGVGAFGFSMTTNVTAYCPAPSAVDTVTVRTWSTTTDTVADRSFHLIVFCPK